MTGLIDSPIGWALRYAPHIGYAPPSFEPLFSYLPGGTEIDRQVPFIAEQGYAGVFHPWITSKTPDEIRQFSRLLREHKLEAGCVLYAGLESIMKPAWVSRSEDVRRDLMAEVTAASAIATEIGSRTIAVLVMADPNEPMSMQLAALRDNLKFAADLASRHGVVLCIEPMVALPGMLFQSTYDAADLLREVDHPAARLIFDTGHVADMDGDVLAAQKHLHDIVGVYQLADVPGRTEPGSGALDFTRLLARLIADGYGGLVELEHGWLTAGAEGERAGIEALREVDKRAAEAAD